MRLPFVKEFSPIGLDLGSRSFKAVQLVRVGGTWQVSSAVALPRLSADVPLAAADLQRLRGVLDRQGFVGRDVVLSVPPAAMLSAVLELPAKTPGLPLEQLALAEFSRLNKLDVSTLTLSTWELPPSVRASRATYMLAAGAKTTALEAHVDLVESADLHVIAADDPHSATARGCLHGVADAVDMTAILDIGWQTTTLSILHGRTLVYTRKLADSGSARVCRAASEARIASAADAESEVWRVGFGGAGATGDLELRDVVTAQFAAMLRETGMAFGYATHQYPDVELNRVLLTGGGAMLPSIESRLTDALAVDSRAAGVPEAVSPVSMQALGLALWQEAA